MKNSYLMPKQTNETFISEAGVKIKYNINSVSIYTKILSL